MVEVGWGVDVDRGVKVTMTVDVIVEKSGVLLGMGVLVGGTAGVRVGTFGTHRTCPA